MNKSFSPFLESSLLRFSSNMFPYSEYIRSENTEDEGVQSNFHASSCISGNWVGFFHHSRGSDFRLMSGNDKNGSISCATSCSLVLPRCCLVEVVDSMAASCWVAISMKHERKKSSSFDLFLCRESGGNCDSWSLFLSSTMSAMELLINQLRLLYQLSLCLLLVISAREKVIFVPHVAVTYSFFFCFRG